LSSFKPMPTPAYDAPPAIMIVDDEVVMVGPGSVAFSMTRRAAQETHRRLGAILAPPGPKAG
jgi:hypothetical protein